MLNGLGFRALTMLNGLGFRALTNRWTHTETDGTDSITSTANMGGKNIRILPTVSGTFACKI